MRTIVLCLSVFLLASCASSVVRISDFASESARLSVGTGSGTRGIEVESTDDGLLVRLLRDEQTLRVVGVQQFRGTLQPDRADLELRASDGEIYTLDVTPRVVLLFGRGQEFRRERDEWPSGSTEVVDWE